LKDKSIGLIKWQKAGLENLLGGPCIKRRIRRRAIRDYQMGECQNASYSFNVAPTYLQCKLTLNLDDYGKKASMERACNKKGRAEMTLPSRVGSVRQRVKFWGTVHPTSQKRGNISLSGERHSDPLTSTFTTIDYYLIAIFAYFALAIQELQASRLHYPYPNLLNPVFIEFTSY
jgi:hypothetical protein